MLLIMVTLISVVPTSVFAAINDIVGNDSGVLPETLGQGGSINWPVKIYDYLNDGMLFEPATGRTGTSSATYSNTDMPYGGGRLMPKATLGMNYGLNEAYTDYAYATLLPQLINKKGSPNYNYARVKATRFEDPQHLHLTYPGAGSYDKYPLISFLSSSNITTGAKAKADIRYMAVVYRMNGRDSDEKIDFFLEDSTNYENLYGYVDGNSYGAELVNTDTWSYIVIDLQEALGESRWGELSTVSGVYLASTMDDSGDYLDLAMVAFYSSETEAKHFGEDGADFANDPGEYLLDGQTLVFGSGTQVPEYYPSASEPGFDLGLGATYASYAPSSQVATSNTYYKTRFGMNFALGTGQSTSTVSAWSSPSSMSVYNNGTTTSFTPTKMTVAKTDDGSQDYVTLSSSSSVSNIVLTNFNESSASGTYRARVRYLVLVYRANNFSDGEKIGFWGTAYKTAGGTYKSSDGYSSGFTATAANWASTSGVVSTVLQESPQDGVWVYNVVDLSALTTNSYTYWEHIGMYLPTSGDRSLDLAYVAYFADSATADVFGEAATGYMNAGKLKGYTTSDGSTETIKSNRSWNAGNNLAYGLLFASDGSTGWDLLAGGNNTNPNGYYSYAIGEAFGATSTASTTYAKINTYRKDFAGNLYTSTGGSNQIYLLSGNAMTSTGANPYDMSAIPFDGYNLLQTYKGGSWLTAGMLEGALVDGKPVYRQETVEYLANLLYETLVIPPFDDDGDYNYNFVKGEKSSQFKLDINGDGDYDDRHDLNGDAYAETYEGSMDLATALRECLGIEFSFGSKKGTYPTKGTYADTQAKASSLMGEFGDVHGSIETCVDAAYFLLNNLFVDNSYNQLQNDYGYLTLSSATMSDGRQGFIFDAGFTTGTGDYTQSGYKENSQSAVVFSPFAYEENGVTKYGTGTIGIQGVGSKDRIATTDSDTTGTTRFPFLPVTDTEGDYPKDTEIPYFNDDGADVYSESDDTYEGRNYNYALVSNGEFVYYKEDNLYFEFEGDDDVYLFINNQLVLDIGGAHGMATVGFQLNDYVDWARGVLASPSSYSEAEIARAEALNLTEGQICKFDFFYMERKGFGANCRIVTNMQVTDPSLKVQKDAYQFGTQVPYGSVVDTGSPIEYSFSMTNTGNTKLYNLSFTDATIGVTLDPSATTADKALVIAPGSTVQDAYGGTLDPTDLKATVTGYKPATGGKYRYDYTTGEYIEVAEGDTDGTHDYVEIDISFASDTELWNFLRFLQGEGLDNTGGDEQLTQQGAGLWVDGTVTIRGIYYKMTQEQIDLGVLNNTVEISATTKVDSESAGNEILRGTASHRVYKPGQPIYYNWAGHSLTLTYDEIYYDAKDASGDETDPLHEYQAFFDGVNMDYITARIVDKYGVVKDYGDQLEKTGTGIATNYENAGTYSFYILFMSTGDGSVPSGATIDYIQANCQGKYAIVPVTVYAVSAQDSTYVLDCGLPTDTLDENGELFATSGSIDKTFMGVTMVEPAYIEGTGNNRIDFDSLGNNLTSVDMGEGTFDLSYENGKLSDLTFTPRDFMKQAYTVWLAITAHTSEDGFVPTELGKAINNNKEAQMYKKITVLPASVVYYEENFAGVTYEKNSGNTFTSYSTGTGVLTQSGDQNGVYGRDPVYQYPADPDVSGGSMWKVSISNAQDVAKFTFTGTGFEMIGRTNATDSGIMVVSLYDAATYAAYEQALESDPTAAAPAAEQVFPVITRFDNGNNGGIDAIYQVPTIRINNLERKAYTVVIAGNPSYDFSNWDGNPDTLENCPVKTTYLYIDGFRVFQPLSAAEEELYYSDTEKGATFSELRDLIVSGKVAVAELQGSGLQVSSGTTTWTEKLFDENFDSSNPATYTGTKVSSATEYLIQGPNNEVYMDGSVTNSAIAFHVKESSGNAHSLQIGARALDYSMFYGAGTSPMAVTLQYGIETADGYGWKNLVTITSGTEQYYSVPYYDCPVDENGNYRVLIRAINTDEQIPAMVSYSMLKTVGLEVAEIAGHGEATDLYFQDGILVNPEYYLGGVIDGQTVSVKTDAAAAEAYKLNYNQLEVTFTQESTIYIDRKLGTKSITSYKASTSDLEESMILTSANTNAITVPAGQYKFYVEEADDGSLTLTVSSVSAVALLSLEEETPSTTVTMNLFSVKRQMIAGTALEVTPVVQPTLTVQEPSVSFEGEVRYNIYFTAENLDDVVEIGLALFDTKVSDGSVENANQVIPGYFTDGDRFMVQTGGIAPKNMGDAVYFRIYAKLTDGSYVYTAIRGYNAIVYANNILKNSTDTNMKALVVAMLNYGAAAQQSLDYKTDSLMNASLTAEHQTLVSSYNESMMNDIVAVDSAKVGSFAYNSAGYSGRRPSVSFDGAFSINYYFTTKLAPENGLKLYYWTLDAYNAADVLSADNASGSMDMTDMGSNQYWGNVADIVAKNIDQTVFVAAVYTNGGVEYSTGVLAYSVGGYCEAMINAEAGASSQPMTPICSGAAVYGYYAKQYFAALAQ